MENLISTLQLKAGRAVLGIGVREIGSYVGVSGAAISLWENNKGHNNLKITPERNLLLIHFFQNRGIFFPDKKSISLISDSNRYNSNSLIVLTRFQLKAARAMLNLTQLELANYIGVSRELITRAERLNNADFIRPKETEVVSKIRKWFEEHKIHFIDNLSLSFLSAE
jgi:DNA-binding XRE family transcriptional regulator